MDTEEAEATSSSHDKGSPGFIYVAASTEGHLEYFPLSIILQGITDHASQGAIEGHEETPLSISNSVPKVLQQMHSL